MVFLAQKKTTQTEPPPPENRKLGLAVQEIKKMVSTLAKTDDMAQKDSKRNIVRAKTYR